MRSGGRGTAWTRGALAALTLLAPGAAAPSASATDVVIEGDMMTLAPGAVGNKTYPDTAADGGTTLALYNNGAATKTVSVPQSTTHLLVRVRGTGCSGAPTVSVKVDGIQRYAGPVSEAGYRAVGAQLSVAAGTHTVSVNMTNDYSLVVGPEKICDRNVYVDNVRVVGQPFSPTGWRNAPLPADTATAANSDAMRGDIEAQMADENAPHDVWITTTEGFSIPIYVVNKDQPKVPVAGPADMGEQWRQVPLPPDARPSLGPDGRGERALVVWQPDTDTMWEFFNLRKDMLGNWTAQSGGRIQNVSSHEGQFEDPPGRRFGASATAIAYLAGIPRIEELKRGVIDHAIDFAVTNSEGYDGWCWPAHRTDDAHTRRDAAAIPGGTRFRLPATLNLDDYAATHPMHPLGLAIARAVQKYGMIARDQGAGFGFWAEDPTPTGTNPYPGAIFAGAQPDGSGVFKNFPWKQLQALPQPAGPDRVCRDDDDPD